MTSSHSAAALKGGPGTTLRVPTGRGGQTAAALKRGPGTTLPVPTARGGQPAAALKGGPVWLVTFATYRRRQIFANLDLLAACAEALRETTQRNGYQVHALAIMPDHVHVVVAAGETGHPAPKVANNLKGVTSRRIFQASPDLKMDLQSEHPWADEYQACPLLGPSALRSACRYVERNPARVGFPAQFYDWLRVPDPRPALQGGGASATRAEQPPRVGQHDPGPALQGGSRPSVAR